MNCLSVFDHFVGLAPKGLKTLENQRFYVLGGIKKTSGIKWVNRSTLVRQNFKVIYVEKILYISKPLMKEKHNS